MTPSKITIHMVSSLDGFIEKLDGTISWMQSDDYYANGTSLSAIQISEFLDAIDCYVMGSKTYERALSLGWPYGDKPVFVFTTRVLEKVKNSVTFISGDLIEISEKLKADFQNIWVVGGAFLTKEFLRLNLVDEIVKSIMPILLGNGVLFFDFIGKEIPLRLKNVSAYKDGMVELTYKVK